MKKNVSVVQRLRGIVFSALGVCLTAGCAASGREPVRYAGTAMGTVVSWQIYAAEENGAAEAVSEEICAAVEDLEAALSWRDDSSELAAVNRTAGDPGGAVLSPALKKILERCLDVSEASEGAFDVTIGQVVRLWDIDDWAAGEKSGEYQIPKERQIRELLEDAGYEKLSLSGDRLCLPQGMALDLGAVGKGAALDEILALLEENEQVSGAVVSLGGSVLTYGEKPDGSAWSVGIADPLDPDRMIGALSLDGQWCVSTSGDYERYVEVDGIRYHHLLDPATGYPADSGVRSVTVLAREGVLSDALSTACFVLGEERGLALVGQYGAEALFVDGEGKIVMTDGMARYFH